MLGQFVDTSATMLGTLAIIWLLAVGCWQRNGHLIAMYDDASDRTHILYLSHVTQMSAQSMALWSAAFHSLVQRCSSEACGRAGL